MINFIRGLFRNPVTKKPKLIQAGEEEKHLKEAIKRFKDWNWRNAKRILSIDYRLPFVRLSDGKEQDIDDIVKKLGGEVTGLYHMGMVVSICYICERKGVPAIEWMHFFGEKDGNYPIILGQSNTNNHFNILGGSFKITKRGFVG